MAGRSYKLNDGGAITCAACGTQMVQPYFRKPWTIARLDAVHCLCERIGGADMAQAAQNARADKLYEPLEHRVSGLEAWREEVSPDLVSGSPEVVSGDEKKYTEKELKAAVDSEIQKREKEAAYTRTGSGWTPTAQELEDVMQLLKRQSERRIKTETERRDDIVG